MIRWVLALTLCLVCSTGVVGAVCINELMSSNQTTLQDEDGNWPDWIELYNPDDRTVDLAGCGLTDDEKKPFKWIFPAAALPPQGFLLIYASDKNRHEVGRPLHTNFKIKSSSEVICLTAFDGQTLDRVTAPAPAPDMSWGRLPDGGDAWDFFVKPTPNGSNNGGQVGRTTLPPQFSAPAGFYRRPMMLSLDTPQAAARIFYTTDGSLPDSTKLLYSEPLQLDSTTVIRACTFRSGGDPGDIVSQTFFIDEQTSLPVVSLITDPMNLWVDDYGIYTKGKSYQPDFPYKGANFWREWERPVFLQFFEQDGSPALSADAGMRIFGHWSVGAPFKPLVLYARKKYGSGKFRAQLFPDLSIREFEAFILRNSGNDWHRTLFRDALVHSLAAEIGLPTQAYRPVLVFLNGQYWGIHNLRERMNEHYLASHFGVRADALDLIAMNYGFQVYAGDSLNYVALKRFIQTHDLSSDEHYQYVASQIDVDNLIDYFIVEIYGGNRDWPHNNLHLWRPRRDDGKWMWLIKDMDHWFGHQAAVSTNTLRVNALRDQFFPYLLKNDGFRRRFLTRFAFLMSTLFEPQHVTLRIDSMKTRLLPEMERHLRRWAGVESYGNPPQNVAEWLAYVDELYMFAERRAPFVKKDLIDQFALSGMATLTVINEDSGGGCLYLDGRPLPTHVFRGDFFRDVPMTLRAEAKSGFQFVGWDGVVGSDSLLTLSLVGDTRLVARFAPIFDPQGFVVINEINDQSSMRFPVCDWIELTNTSDRPIDLSSWRLSANAGTLFTFPAKTMLPPEQFLLVVGDSTNFYRFFPWPMRVLGNFQRDLPNGGGVLQLYDANDRLIDQVSYTNSPPWPLRCSDATLALVLPMLDNDPARNWFAADLLGTPGEANIRQLPEILLLQVERRDSTAAADLRWRCSGRLSPLLFQVIRPDDERRIVSNGEGIGYQPDGWYTFTDRSVADRPSYQVRIFTEEQPTGVWEPAVKTGLRLKNHPNPFNQVTTFSFYLPEADHAALAV